MDLDALEKALEKATPGPWYAVSGKTYGPSEERYLRAFRYGDDDVGQDETGGQYTVNRSPNAIGWECDGGHPGYGIHRDDAEAIAVLRNAAPALIALARAGQNMRVIVRRESCSLEPDGEALTTALRAYDAATKGGGTAATPAPGKEP